MLFVWSYAVENDRVFLLFCFLLLFPDFSYVNSNYTIVPVDNAMYKTSARRKFALQHISKLVALQHVGIQLKILFPVK